MRNLLCLLLLAGVFLLNGCSPQDIKKDVYKPLNTGEKAAAQETAKTAQDEKTPAGTPQKEPEKQGEKYIEKTPVTIYYQDSDGNIIPVTRKIPKQAGIARAAVSELIDTVENRERAESLGLLPVLPEGTAIKGLNIYKRVAVIDFNPGVLEYKNKTAEKNIVAAVVYTLTGFRTVDNVEILVNGRNPGKLRYGTDLSAFMNRGNILVNSDSVNMKKGAQKLDAYLLKYLSEKYVYLVPISYEYDQEQEEKQPYRLVEILTGKAFKEGIHTELPAGVKLLKSELKNGVLTLDFSPELKDYGGTAREDGIIKQLSYSMMQLKGVKKMRILVGGKGGTLPEGTEIGGEFALQGGINAVAE